LLNRVDVSRVIRRIWGKPGILAPNIAFSLGVSVTGATPVLTKLVNLTKKAQAQSGTFESIWLT
jgi:hypothetical protein